MTKIFLSHSSKDAEFTYPLYQKLRSVFGDVIWVYFKDNVRAISWRDGVDEGLRTCIVMVLVASPDAMESPEVKKEWRNYLENGKPIIPVVCRETRNWRYDIGDLYKIVFHERDYGIAFRELCEILENEGIQPIQPSTQSSATINCKRGNVWWLCHDLLELFRWLLEGIPKQWIDIGFRQSHHHATELGLSENV